MVLANTLGEHPWRTSLANIRHHNGHAPNGIHHSQIDYILVQNRYRSGIKTAITRTFPGADVGSDLDLVIMNFKVRLKKINKPKNIRLKFNLELFQATIGGKFAPLLKLDEEAEAMITKFNAVMTEIADEILGKQCRKTQPWVTDEILEMCDKRRDLKKNRNTTTGAVAYKECNNKIRKAMNKAKEDWIEKQCADIEDSLNKNNSRRAFQVVKELTKQRQSRVSTIQDKKGNCLTEEKDITER